MLRDVKGLRDLLGISGLEDEVKAHALLNFFEENWKVFGGRTFMGWTFGTSVLDLLEKGYVNRAKEFILDYGLESPEVFDGFIKKIHKELMGKETK